MLDWRSEATDGEWLGGDTAEALPARLIAGPEQLVVTTGEGTVVARWPIASIRVDMLHDGDVAHLESKSDPDRLAVTRDLAFVAKLRARGAVGGGLPRGKRALVIGLLCLGAVASLFAGLYAAAPWLSRRAAERVPLSVERRLNSELGDLFGRYSCETEDSKRALTALKARLDPKRRSPATLRITNVGAPNAFALPGGDVLLTRGLLEEATSADEVAGVLAHELAHVEHRHVLAELIETTLLGSIWAVTIGDYSGLLVIDPRTMYNVITLRHSRDAEQEADLTGARVLKEAGISTAGLIAFFERNGSKLDDQLSFLSTHPASSERITALRAGVTPGSAPALDEASFAALKGACAAAPAVPRLSDVFD